MAGGYEEPRREKSDAERVSRAPWRADMKRKSKKIGCKIKCSESIPADNATIQRLIDKNSQKKKKKSGILSALA